MLSITIRLCLLAVSDWACVCVSCVGGGGCMCVSCGGRGGVVCVGICVCEDRIRDKEDVAWAVYFVNGIFLLLSILLIAVIVVASKCLFVFSSLSNWIATKNCFSLFIVFVGKSFPSNIRIDWPKYGYSTEFFVMTLKISRKYLHCKAVYCLLYVDTNSVFVVMLLFFFFFLIHAV